MFSQSPSPFPGFLCYIKASLKKKKKQWLIGLELWKFQEFHPNIHGKTLCKVSFMPQVLLVLLYSTYSFNKALMRHRHQVWLSIIIQMPKVWLWSEEWCVAQSPAWRFGFCICARVRIPVKKQCFSICVACCKIHAWKTLRKEVYCGIAVLVIAKFAAHLCCVCFFYFFFSGADLRVSYPGN